MNTSIENELHNAGIAVDISQGVHYFRINDAVPMRAQRFAALQQLACRTQAPQLVYLTCMDLVNPKILPSLAGKPLIKYRIEPYTYLELQCSVDKTWRVALSELSALIFNHEIAIEKDQTDSMLRWYLDASNDLDGRQYDPMDELRNDQLCWAFLHLPPAAFAIWCGLISTARLDLKLNGLRGTNLVMCQLNADTESDLALVPRVLDLHEQDRRVETSHNQALIRQAIDCLRTHANWTQRQHISDWNQRLKSMLPQLQNATHLTVLVFGWICDLVASGTTQKGEKSRYLTRRKYIFATAIRLLDALSQLPSHFSIWDAHLRRKAYDGILFDIPTTERQIVSAALLSFQKHLEDWYSIAPVFITFDKEFSLSCVRAQLVPAQCIKRALSWIDESFEEDPLLKTHLGVALSLGAAAPFRINELLYLRFCNLQKCSDGSFEIEVTSRPGWKDIKTDSAKRRVYVRNKEALSRLEQLIDLRRAQGCTSSDLLFSHANEPDIVYRRYLLHAQLLLLLKASTGDAEMTFHALRHTWASNQLLEVFQQQPPLHHNPLTQRMVEIGHASLNTTFSWYFHFRDELARTCVDNALRAHLDPGADLTSSLAGVQDNTLRQRSRRSVKPLREVRMEAIASEASQRAGFDLAKLLGFVEPLMPRFSTKAISQLSARAVLNTLIALEAGQDDNLVAARSGIDLSYLSKIKTDRDQLTNWLAALMRPAAAPNDLPQSADINFSSAFQARYKNLLPSLNKVEFSPEVIDGLRAWRECRTRYGQIGLTHIPAATRLLIMLAVLGAKPENIRIHIPVSKSDKNRLLVAQLMQLFITVFAERPKNLASASQSPRFPVIYLTWTGSHLSNDFQHDSASVRGLDAILCSLYIFLFSEFTNE